MAALVNQGEDGKWHQLDLSETVYKSHGNFCASGRATYLRCLQKIVPTHTFRSYAYPFCVRRPTVHKAVSHKVRCKPGMVWCAIACASLNAWRFAREIVLLMLLLKRLICEQNRNCALLSRMKETQSSAVARSF